MKEAADEFWPLIEHPVLHQVPFLCWRLKKPMNHVWWNFRWESQRLHSEDDEHNEYEMNMADEKSALEFGSGADS